MLNNEEHYKRTQSTFSYDDNLTEWEKESLHEQRFDKLDLPILQRIGVENKEYHIFSDEKEFKAVSAKTATLALEQCEIEKPLKIDHTNCRIDDVIEKEKLEFVENDAQNSVESSSDAETATTENEAPAESEPTPEAASDNEQS